MAYVPNYQSIYDSASVNVEPIIVSGNTTENFEQNAKDMGVNVIKDTNGRTIGYDTNTTVTSYENGEYVERTTKVPLYPHLSPDSTQGNIIIEYKPYERYEAHDGTVYEDGSATFLVNKEDYLKSALSATGIDIDYDVIDTTILDALWENYKDDITHSGGLVDNPIYNAILGDSPYASLTEADTMALGRMRISDFAMKYLDSEDNIAKLLKAAASVGLYTVDEVIEDDPVTREYFRYHVNAGDYVELKSMSGDGSKIDTDWVAAFVRPMVYAATINVNRRFPSDAQWLTYYYQNTTTLIPTWYDNQCYSNNGHHINMWAALYCSGVWTGRRNEVAMCGFYYPSGAKVKVEANYPTRGYALINMGSATGASGYWRPNVYLVRGFQNGWDGSYGSNNYNSRGWYKLVYCNEDYMAYLSSLGTNPGAEFNDNQGLILFAGARKGSSIPGVTKKDNTLQITAQSTVAEIKTQMQQQYPDWYNNTVVQNEYNIFNNTSTPVTYLPIGINNTTDPQKGEITREVVESNINYYYDYTYNSTPNNPMTLPDSEPTHGVLQSNKFWTVYSPTNSQLNELGQHLWNQNVIDILKQTFVNPTDGIISFHQIYVTPEIMPQEHICMGVYDTGVYAGVVENFTKTIECGYVTVPKYFNDVRDYTETRVSIYLPFIGIEELDARDVIGYALRLRYKIDILTGTCVAYISPNKKEATSDNHDSNLSSCTYIFTGNCAVQLPITAADRSRLLSGIAIGVIGGAKAGSKLGGHPVAGAVAGAILGGLQGVQSDVYRSNGIQANAGALALTMIPYVIVQRQKPADAYKYPVFYGKPNNATIALQLCQGFTRVKEVIFNTVKANEIEKLEIERLLKEGIII